MDKKLYAFNYSQDIIHLQTKYALFKRVANILFSVTFDDGFDEGRMLKALQLLIDRNDCLRLTFVKEGKEMRQFFEPSRKLDKVSAVRFDTTAQMEAWVRRFRRKGLDMTKGQTFQAVFAVNPSGEQMVFIKISHYVADTYGIGVLVADLLAVYAALRDGNELPPAPGSFEDIIRKDNEYRNDATALERDKSYYRDYYLNRHPEHPVYCGTHGNRSDRWLKFKRKGEFGLPYLFVRCDTEPYQFAIPNSITQAAEKWCMDNSISMTAFFLMSFSLALSLINDRERRMSNVLILNCRGTVADRKTAGTKASAVAEVTDIDYEKSFLDHANVMTEEQNEFFRHTRLSYLEMEAIQHEAWKFSMLRFLNCSGFSYIPFTAPDGVTFQLHSNGKGALVTYIAIMHDVKRNEVFINYDVQKLLVTAAQLVDFQNVYNRVMEKVLANPNAPLNELF